MPRCARKAHGKSSKPDGPKSKDTLTVTDNRTGETITVPITHNSIPATAFKALKTVPASSSAGAGSDTIDTDDTANGIRVYDPAFLNTAAISSKITFIDGDRGFLMHRGYPLEQLAEKSDFLETAYLLIYGELPDKEQSDVWRYEIMHHTTLAEDVLKVIGSMR